MNQENLRPEKTEEVLCECEDIYLLSFQIKDIVCTSSCGQVSVKYSFTGEIEKTYSCGRILQ